MLKSRLSNVSQYSNIFSLRGTQKYSVPTLEIAEVPISTETFALGLSTLEIAEVPYRLRRLLWAYRRC